MSPLSCGGRSVISEQRWRGRLPSERWLLAPFQGCILVVVAELGAAEFVAALRARLAPGSALTLGHHCFNPLNQHVSVHRDRILTEGTDTA